MENCILEIPKKSSIFHGSGIVALGHEKEESIKLVGLLTQATRHGTIIAIDKTKKGLHKPRLVCNTFARLPIEQRHVVFIDTHSGRIGRVVVFRIVGVVAASIVVVVVVWRTVGASFVTDTDS